MCWSLWDTPKLFRSSIHWRQPFYDRTGRCLGDECLSAAAFARSLPDWASPPQLCAAGCVRCRNRTPLVVRADGAEGVPPHPGILIRPKPWPSLLGWSLALLAGATLAHRLRKGLEQPSWTLFKLFTRGNPLNPRWRPKTSSGGRIALLGQNGICVAVGTNTGRPPT